MTPEEKNLLERAVGLAEENNALLLSLRRSNRLSLIVKIIYWGVIIGLSVGAAYFIKPYFNFLTGITGGGSSSASAESSASSSNPYSMSSIESAASSLRQLFQQQSQ